MMASGLSNLHHYEQNWRTLQLGWKGLGKLGLGNDLRREVHVNNIFYLTLISKHAQLRYLVRSAKDPVEYTDV